MKSCCTCEMVTKSSCDNGTLMMEDGFSKAKRDAPSCVCSALEVIKEDTNTRPV